MIEPATDCGRRTARVAATLLAVTALLGAASAQTDAPPADPARSHDVEPDMTRRVIVHESRRREVSGFVEFEDEKMLFLRRLDDGDLERFTKERVVAIVRLVDPLPDQRGIVYLRGGQQRRGIILEDSFEQVVVEIEGVKSTLPRDLVDHVQLLPSFEQQYRAFKATLRPEMLQSNLALVQWLIDEGQLDLAALELDELLRRHDSPEAKQLLRVVAAHQELAQQPVRPVPPREERPAADGQDAPGPLLSRDDVNLIQVYEIDFRHPPKVEVPRATIERLFEQYAGSPLLPTDPDQRKALFRADPILIVEELIFRLQARDLYGDINVLTEPYALNLFRQRVHNAWLMNNCSTSRCHGGPDAGRLYLHRRNPKSARARYTNLLILERLDIDPEWRLIDYDTPLDSLIIQYGLPRPLARRPHPVARGWKPVFRGTDDRMVRRTVEWIEAMMKPRVEYPVDFDPGPAAHDPAAHDPAAHDPAAHDPAPPAPPPAGEPAADAADR